MVANFPPEIETETLKSVTFITHLTCVSKPRNRWAIFLPRDVIDTLVKMRRYEVTLKLIGSVK